jgi:hypothetical protein
VTTKSEAPTAPKKTYYKATRPDGTSFYDESTRWRVGRITRYPNPRPELGLCSDLDPRVTIANARSIRDKVPFTGKMEASNPSMTPGERHLSGAHDTPRPNHCRAWYAGPNP